MAILVTAIILALIGLYLGIGGGWLIALGGSWYYLITGLATLVSSVVAGLLWDWHGPDATFLAGGLFAALAAVLVLGVHLRPAKPR